MASTPALTSEPLFDAGDKSGGFRLSWERPIGGSEHYLHSVRWPILQGSEASPTFYGVVVALDVSQRGVKHDCTAGAYGREQEQAGPFHCSLIQRGQGDRWDMYITDDRVERIAEASGSITTDSSLALEDGNYQSIYPPLRLRLDGAPVVPAGSSTQFDAVATPEDTYNPVGEREGNIYFSYALVDDGRPVYGSDGKRAYVSGLVRNNRVSPGRFYCDVATRGDLGAGTVVPGYSCDTVSSYATDWGADERVHFVTHFTVRKTQ
jgi:hypothetical protein